MKKTAHTLLALLAIMLIAGCDNGGDCSIYNVSYYRALFYNIDDKGKEQPHSFPEPLDVSLVVNGTDSVVVNNMTSSTELALPMCYTQECDTLVLHFGYADDTLYIGHTNIPYFISMDCGTGMYHELTSITHTRNFVDSVSIVHPYINFDANENIKIYIAE